MLLTTPCLTILVPFPNSAHFDGLVDDVKAD